MSLNKTELKLNWGPMRLRRWADKIADAIFAVRPRAGNGTTVDELPDGMPIHVEGFSNTLGDGSGGGGAIVMPQFQVGTVETLEPGEQAEMTLTQEGNIVTVNIKIPRGDVGAEGPIGPEGSPGADSTVPGPAGPVGPKGDDGDEPTGATGTCDEDGNIDLTLTY